MVQINAPISGIYAITPEQASPGDLVEKVAAALCGGVRWIQYRDKSNNGRQRLAAAKSLRDLTRQFNAGLIINDDVGLALAVSADGVHLGRDDGDLLQARARLGSRILGASCYASLQLARNAEQAGASYIAFGALFKSPTKPNAEHCSLALLTDAKAQVKAPLVAIGGIHLGNAGAVVAAGADAVAVSSGIFAADNVELAARQLCNIFTRISTTH